MLLLEVGGVLKIVQGENGNAWNVRPMVMVTYNTGLLGNPTHMMHREGV